MLTDGEPEMSDGFVEMQRMIKRLRKLGQSAETIAADIAPELRAEIEKNIAASRGPDGTPWKPTQKGNPPLQNAASVLGVAAIGTKVILALRGIEARHHYGHVKGKIGRPILPLASFSLPKQFVKIITDTATKRFRMITGGA